MTNRSLKIPYEIISSAKQGNENALSYILRVFNPYIKKIAARPHYDVFGNFTQSTDEDMEAYIQYRLVMGILNNFEILPQNE
ncbi:MAG: helix-turn-helix domain-containing protein [bacterium]|nr:helix-turn-helix domain-containing protein [bacterium]